MSSYTFSTAFTVSSQMVRDEIMTSRAHEHPASPFADKPADFVEHELIPTTSRLSRLPTAVPDLHKPSSSPTSAISAHQNSLLNLPSGQDVHYSVNTSASSVRSPATSTIGPLEAFVSSFTPSLTQNDLKHPIRRPRTSTHVFQSSSDLAAHYGIPQRLPPVPSTSSRQHPAAASSPKEYTDLADFQTLSQNYIKMLSTKECDPMPSVHTPLLLPTRVVNPPGASPTQADLDHLAALIVASPEFRQYSDFMTSPMMPELAQDSPISPDETPYEDFLNTPLIEADEYGTSPMLPLFPDFEDPGPADESSLKSQYPPPTPLLGAPYTISPTSPSLDAFESFTQPPSALSPPPADTRRVSKATGIRKGITVDALLDETAPTQPRKYLIPSATSKKEIPATFARKRSRSVAFCDEEDELGDDGPLNENEKQLIEQKRLKNTLAARKSRRRKLEQYQNMEKSRDEERELKQVWKERALMLLQTLRKQGVNYPDFPEDVLLYELA